MRFNNYKISFLIITIAVLSFFSFSKNKERTISFKDIHFIESEFNFISVDSVNKLLTQTDVFSKNILKSLEKSHSENNDIQIDESSEMQLTFFDMDNKNYEEFKDELESIDTDNITPMEALVKLSELKNKITDEK